MKKDYGVVGNADRWVVTFIDNNKEPADPDSDVVWVVYYPGEPPETIRQQVHEKISKGTYELRVTPRRPWPYSVKVSSTVEGVPQSPEAMEREVRP